MASFSRISELAGAVISLVAYGWLFFSTIRQNRKNRGIVLGVVTVAMFGGFLFYAYLAEKHSPPWLLRTVEAVIISTGLSVIALVTRDVFRWVSARRQTAPRSNDRTAES
jgi:protein-S-isoprenylcysteine O-methyltransferase Ste14